MKVTLVLHHGTSKIMSSEKSVKEQKSYLIKKEIMDTQTLIELLKSRGWQDASRTVLDVIEPVAPLVSQFLWVFQPISGMIGARNMIGELAETLDTPDGIARLRDQLGDK